MTPISPNYTPVVRGERERPSIPQATMEELSRAVHHEKTRILTGPMWLETGWYNTTLVTARKGIIVPVGNIEIDRIVPATIQWIEQHASDYVNFGGARVEFDQEENVILVTPADSRTTLRLDPGIEKQKFPCSPEISPATGRTILALMMLDRKVDPAIYRKLREQGLIFVHLGKDRGIPSIKGFAVTSRTLKRLGQEGYEDGTLYSFDESLTKKLLNPYQIRRFHPIPVLTNSNPKFLQGFPKIA